MGLRKEYEIGNTGVTVSYWRTLVINTGEPDAEHSVAHIDIAGYATQELREAGKRPLVILPYDVTAGDFSKVFGHATSGQSVQDAMKTAVYDWLKSLDPTAANSNGPDFRTSENC